MTPFNTISTLCTVTNFLQRKFAAANWIVCQIEKRRNVGTLMHRNRSRLKDNALNDERYALYITTFVCYCTRPVRPSVRPSVNRKYINQHRSAVRVLFRFRVLRDGVLHASCFMLDRQALCVSVSSLRCQLLQNRILAQIASGLKVYLRELLHTQIKNV